MTMVMTAHSPCAESLYVHHRKLVAQDVALAEVRGALTLVGEGVQEIGSRTLSKQGSFLYH